MVHKAAMHGAMGMMMGMTDFFFTQWYDEDVSPHLTMPQKKKLLMKISDYSLEHNITEPNVEIDKSVFPELAPFMHTEKLSGLQVYAVMKGLFREVKPKEAKRIDL
jgi:hypothetical protein